MPAKARDSTENNVQSQLTSPDDLPQRIGSNVADVTTALDPALQPLLEWGAIHGISSELLRLIDVTLLQAVPLAAGSVLGTLRTDYASVLLERWASANEHAGRLLRLSTAIRSMGQPGLLVHYRPLPVEKPAKTYFPGQLDTFYLVAYLAARLPPFDQQAQVWCERLKLWLLVHAMGRAEAGNRLDGNLQVACTRLRMAHDGNDRALEIVIGLANDASDFDRLGAQLQLRCGELITARSGSEPLSRYDRQLLDALTAIARYEHAPVARADLLPPLLRARESVSRLPGEIYFWQPRTPPEEGDIEAADLAVRVPATDDDLPDLLVTEADPNKSYVQQALSAKSVLLATQEDLHYLPWAWNRPAPHERQLLRAWIDKALLSSDRNEALIAALAWIAIATANTLRRTLEIQLGEESSPTWRLSLTRGCLHRLPARRLPGWQPSGAEEAAWVRPSVDSQLQEIPAAVVSILREQSGKLLDPPPTRLAPLWTHLTDETPDAVFRRCMKDVAPRIVSGMLSNLAPQETFEASRDSTFARLLTSHPESGLPGACAYPSWSASDLRKIAAAVPCPPSVGQPSAEQNVLGSRLDVLDNLLANEICSVRARVDQYRLDGDVIGLHNATVLYLLLMLYAATGARPLRDPFESVRHFGWRTNTLYINDKSSGKARDGRLVPLIEWVSAQIQEGYLAHLALLSRHVAEVDASLAQEILRLSSGRISQRVPFFFLLSEDRGLHWQHASETNLDALGIFNCPLPFNLFRHRLASQLRRLNVDPEIIDAVLGHAEAGAATHGDRSYRVWAADMQSIRPALQGAFDRLGFLSLPDWPTNVRRLEVSSLGESPAQFGARARAKERRIRTQAALRSARGIIAEALMGRSLDALSDNEVTELSRRLLSNESGLPHPMGAVRYAMLLRLANRHRRGTGRQLRFRTRYLALVDEATPFTDNAPDATEVLDRLKERLRETERALVMSRLGMDVAAQLAALLVALQTRACSPGLIRDLMAGRNVRLVQKGEMYFLEHADELRAGDPFAPVQRFRVSERCAVLIDQSMGRKHPKELDDAPLPEAAGQICEVLVDERRLASASSSREFWRVLLELVDQGNLQHYPGAVAGYLAGRVKTVALEWADWLRLRWGELREIEASSGDADIAITPLITTVSLPVAPKDDAALQAETRAFFDALRKAFGDPAGDLASGRQGPTTRRVIQTRLRDVLDSWNGKVGQAPAMLGQWFAHLLLRAKGTNAFLAPGTIRRYFAALSPAFEQVAYAATLDLLDEDGVTDLYTQILDARLVQDQSYVVARLTEFHRWAKQYVELEDPLWAELPVVDAGVSVDPGVWTEADYLTALRWLRSRGDVAQSDRDSAGFLLLLVFRFGLRASEALGLLRGDWIQIGSWSIVCVRPNRIRGLKTRASRRLVPLIDQLKAPERDLIERVVKRAEADHGKDLHAPIFEKAQDWAGLTTVRQLAGTAIKAATRNPRTNLHRGRHSAANRVALSLSGAGLSSWKSLGKVHVEKVAGLLLQSASSTRRASPAVARYLGHAGSGTQFGSYLHFIPDWAEALVGLDNPGPKIELRHVVNLEAFKPIDVEANTNEIPAPSPLRVVDVLRILRLLAKGNLPDGIARCLGQPESLVSEIKKTAEVISRKNRRWDENDEQCGTLALLRKIKDPAWDRLIEAGAAVAVESIGISLCDLPDMVGPSRQILAWEARHFEALRRFTDAWQIPAGHYQLFVTEKDPELVCWAESKGFVTQDPRSVGGRRGGVQIDAVQLATEQYKRVYIQIRAGLAFVEQRGTRLRNRYELVAALVASTAASTFKSVNA